MTIALDYDNTYTADPDLWRWFILRAQARGHYVLIATGRREDHPCIRPEVPAGIRIVYCGPGYKVHAMQCHGITVDVWIDDMPGLIEPSKVLEF